MIGTKDLARIYVERLIEVGEPQQTGTGETFIFSNEMQDLIVERTQRQVKTILLLEKENEE